MKKKLVILCLAGIMIFGAGACGSKSEGTTTQTAENGENESDISSEGTDQEELAGVSASDSEMIKVSEREDYIGIQDLDISTYVTLPEYKNISVQANRIQVTDEDIENYINSNLLVGMITDRAVQNGDVVNIDYVGKRDGVAFQGGTDSNAPLEIGSGAFIPGFEEGLIGVMPKSTVDLNITFPEGYSNNPDLAGVEVVFTVTVNGIVGTAEYDTVTPEELESLGIAYSNKEELWEAGKTALEEQAENTYITSVNNAIIAKLKEECIINEVPEYLVEEEIQNYNIYMNSVSQSLYGMDLETFVTSYYQMTMEDYNAELMPMSEDIVKQYLIMEAVKRAEGIEVTDEMLNKLADEEAVSYNYTSGEQLIESVGYTTYRMYMVQDLVLERLRSLVSVEEFLETPETQTSEISDMPETKETQAQ